MCGTLFGTRESTQGLVVTIRIGNNISSLTAQRALSSATDSFGKSLERLSSGLRINRASDDAAGLSVSSILNASARIDNQAIRNLSDGISLLSIAESGTASLKGILERGKELAAQAATGTYSTKQRAALDTELQALVSEYNRIVESTSYNGINLFGSRAPDSISLQAGIGSNAILTTQLGLSEATTTFQGNFTSAGTTAATLVTVSGLSAGDLNGDGITDLVTGSNLDGGFHPWVGVSFGNGDGTFGNRIDLNAGNSAAMPQIADLDGDGDNDIVVANNFTTNFSYFLNNGNGSFGAAISVNTGGQASSLHLGDVDGDGDVDVITSSNYGSGGWSQYGVSFNNGSGIFTSSTQHPQGQYDLFGFDLGDVDQDGRLDIVMYQGASNAISVMVGSGAPGATTKVAEFLYGSGSAAGDPALGDFTGDGDLDFAFGAGTTIQLYVGGIGGTFSGPTTITVGGEVVNVRVTDIDGDGDSDIGFGRSDGVLGVLFNQGNGTFDPAVTFATSIGGNSPRNFAVTDVNGDGIKDFVAGFHGSANVETFLAASATQETTTKIGTISGLSISTEADARATLTAIDPLLDRLTAFASNLGASFSRLQTASRNLETSKEQKVAAASRITDVDTAEESAALVRSRILQNVAVSVLAQANQQPALALMLLRG